jgi:hypothetical protein
VLTGNTPSYMLLKFRRYLQKILPSDNGRFAKKKKKIQADFQRNKLSRMSNFLSLLNQIWKRCENVLLTI